MSSDILTGAANLVTSIAASTGDNVPWDVALKLAEELVKKGAELVDGHAKKKAEAAGDAAAARITTEDQAEKAQRG